MSETMQPAQVPGAAMLPQVNLLPPHVRARRKVAVVRVWLVLLLLIIVLLTAMAGVWTQWQLRTAEAELVELQDSNQALQQQQLQYAEVPQVLQDLKVRREALALAMSSEMLWSPYLAAISAATPLNASIDTVTVSQDTVWTAGPAQPLGPLSTPGAVGQVNINGRAMTLDAVSDWQDALSEVRGFVDAEFVTIETSDDNGTTYYAVSATLSLTPDAFANQFVMEQ